MLHTVDTCTTADSSSWQKQSRWRHKVRERKCARTRWSFTDRRVDSITNPPTAMNVNRSPAELCSRRASPVTGTYSTRRKYHMEKWTSISWGFDWWRRDATSVFSFCSTQPEASSVGHHILSAVHLGSCRRTCSLWAEKKHKHRAGLRRAVVLSATLWSESTWPAFNKITPLKI